MLLENGNEALPFLLKKVVRNLRKGDFSWLTVKSRFSWPKFLYHFQASHMYFPLA